MPDIELPLTGHLAELRTRLAWALLAVAIAFCVVYPGSAYVFRFLEAPLKAAAESRGVPVSIVGTGVAEAFFTRIAVSAIAALFLALPVVLYQLWKFVVPGLQDNEASYARWFVTFGTLFFLCGAAFCYLLVFPIGFPFFLSEYDDIGVQPILRISEYLSFSSQMMAAFGVCFEMPVITFFLARAGVVTHTMLITHSRYAVLGIFVVAAILTPPDAASQMMMATPLCLLYVLSIGVAYWFARRPAVETNDDTAGDAKD
ncbi:MAG: twin-arginine translocase subunit TatC [Deltaproteobacteria bacterium]|nr:twin-arginine translocase subunit TatC [Deltaproteobacteria bacterium]